MCTVCGPQSSGRADDCKVTPQMETHSPSVAQGTQSRSPAGNIPRLVQTVGSPTIAPS